jgi:hypothetical protein
VVVLIARDSVSHQPGMPDMGLCPFPAALGESHHQGILQHGSTLDISRLVNVIIVMK